MAKKIAWWLVVAIAGSCIGCQSYVYRYHGDPYHDPDLEIDSMVPVVLACAVAATAAVVAVKLHEKQRNRRLFAEMGSRVRLLLHEEAPQSARYIGEVECRGDSQTEVKNLLRIKAARLGGDLLVIDTISESSSDYFCFGRSYTGSGRVYRER